MSFPPYPQNEQGFPHCSSLSYFRTDIPSSQHTASYRCQEGQLETGKTASRHLNSHLFYDFATFVAYHRSIFLLRVPQQLNIPVQAESPPQFLDIMQGRTTEHSALKGWNALWRQSYKATIIRLHPWARLLKSWGMIILFSTNISQTCVELSLIALKSIALSNVRRKSACSFVKFARPP